jgi:molecular chaperone GrpE (heat shock protein)
MNIGHRNTVNNIAGVLRQQMEDLQKVEADMQERFDARSEGWQEGERGQAEQERLSTLQEVIDTLESAIADLETAAEENGE